MKQTELEQKMRALRDYCEENNVPVFIMSYQQTGNKQNSGYIYDYLSPACLNIDVKKETGKKDKFPLFLKVLSKKGKGGSHGKSKKTNRS